MTGEAGRKLSRTPGEDPSNFHWNSDVGFSLDPAIGSAIRSTERANHMNPMDWFGVCIRTVGLLVALYGLYALAWGLRDTVWRRADTPVGEYFFTGMLLTIAGGLLINGADVIAAFCYR